MQKASRKAERLCYEYRPLLGGERLLTYAEVADILKVSRRTLQEYHNDGILPYIEMKGKCVYKDSDIEKVIRLVVSIEKCSFWLPKVIEKCK